MRRATKAAPLLALLTILVACGRGQAPIPAGAQVVHVVALESGVRLTPATAHPGDVYLVLEEPPEGGFEFVMRKVAADATPGPLSDDDLARLAGGDTEATEISGLDARGCAPDQRAADRGQMGPCGNVMKVVVTEGKYAILGPAWREMETAPRTDPTADPAGFQAPRSMAVLEVLTATSRR